LRGRGWRRKILTTFLPAHRLLLLTETGCGPLTAALLIGRTAGAQRFKTDASFARQAGVAPIPCSSGQQDRYRLNRGGDRQLNRALHTIAITRARHDPATKAYLARKLAEGKTKREAIRASNATSPAASTTSSRTHAHHHLMTAAPSSAHRHRCPA